jgi:hypothetical protein
MKPPTLTVYYPANLIAAVKKLKYTDWSYEGDANWNHNKALAEVRFILGIEAPKRGLVQPA